jgi:hypothetical protein
MAHYIKPPGRAVDGVAGNHRRRTMLPGGAGPGADRVRTTAGVVKAGTP